MERACCSLKQLIQHADDQERWRLLPLPAAGDVADVLMLVPPRDTLLNFQEAHPLKFLSFCMLTTASLLHACWTLQRAKLIHHDIHPAQESDPDCDNFFAMLSMMARNDSALPLFRRCSSHAMDDLV